MDRYLGGQIATHAEQQGYAFASKTTSDGFNQALEMAATAGSAGDTGHIEVARMRAQQAALKQVQLDGQEGNPDAVNQAVAKARIGVYKSAAEAMAVKDPLAAQAYIDKHKDDLGIAYAPLADQVSARADKAQGFGLNNDASKAVTTGWKAAGTMPVSSVGSVAAPEITQAAAAVPGGYSPQGLAKTIQIESGGKPNATNGGMKGLGQFMDSTWAQYGSGSPFDPQQALLATQRYAAANAKFLTGVLGRQPTDAEIYLAHQQGPGGAEKLLMNPNVRAGDLVGNAAIAKNGGNPDAPASAFTNMWIGRFGGTKGVTAIAPGGGQSMTMPNAGLAGTTEFQAPSVPPAAPEGATLQPAAFTPPAAPQPAGPPNSPDELLARKIQYIEQSGASDRVKAEAAQAAQNDYRMAALAAEANAKAVKDREDSVVNEYDGMALKGQYPQMQQMLANDNRIPANKKLAIQEMIEKRSGESNPVAYGPKYTDIFNRVLAPSSDPNRIGDITELYKAEGAGDLTSKGTERLKTIMNDVRKNNDEYGTQRQVSLAYDYAKRHMVFEQNDGLGNMKITNPKGQDAYDLAFTQIFNNSFDAWKREGKDVTQFPYFQQKKLDELIQQVYPKRQADLDRLNGTDAVTSPTAIPAPPPDADPAAWNGLMQARPVAANGQAWSPTNWAAAVNDLRADPTKEKIIAWDRKFGPIGMSADFVLGRIEKKSDTESNREPTPLAPVEPPGPPVGTF